MRPAFRPAVNAWLWTKPFYRATPHARQPYTWAADSRISISDARRFVYIRVPKAANTMLSHTVFQHAFGRIADTNSEAKNAFRHPSDLRRDEISAIQRDYFCFIFVRNPYERVFSAYWSKVRSQTAQKQRYRDMVRRRIGAPAQDTISFPEFCRYLQEGGLYDDPHWLPQACYAATIGSQHIDAIGRVERLAEDAHNILGRIFPDEPSVRFSDRAGSRNNSGSFLRDYYDDACAAIVRDLYRDDFTMFGYETQLPGSD
jgi:hypothetical protein